MLCPAAAAHLLDVLQGDVVLAQLLVDEDQGVQVAHPAVQQLVRETPGPRYHPGVQLEQPGWGWGGGWLGSIPHAPPSIPGRGGRPPQRCSAEPRTDSSSSGLGSLPVRYPYFC